MTHPYELGLEKRAANYAQLSPVSFLAKAAHVHGARVATIHGDRRLTWREVDERARRLAAALQHRGVGKGDTIATLLPNVPAMVELHFGPAMLGAVLSTLNTRLDAEALAFMLDHADAKVVFVDPELAGTMKRALSLAKVTPLVVDVDDALAATHERIGSIEYEALLVEGDPSFRARLPDDEWDAISLNYTSGTTGDPKGVVYHHRGAALNAVGNILDWGMPRHPVYLWTLPMFHCNGWCFAWTIAAAAGTNVCLRKVDAKLVFELMREHGVTNYCGAPIVHTTLIHAPSELREGIGRVSALVAGAAPPVAVIEGMERMGFDLTHVYGLTETYGPAAVCAKQPEWGDLSLEERAVRNGRQGAAYLLEDDMSVRDPETLAEVPWDGETVGEIMFRGNITMKGYLKNPRATEAAFAGGWFHSGDLAVVEPDGYVKIKDRSKDIIISGGENISSLEVEDVLSRHPAVLSSAVVAKPDEKWGETPCAFVELKAGASAEEGELIAFCRERLAHFKAPKQIVFGALPRTSTGKIQKFMLRRSVGG